MKKRNNRVLLYAILILVAVDVIINLYLLFVPIIMLAPSSWPGCDMSGIAQIDDEGCQSGNFNLPYGCIGAPGNYDYYCGPMFCTEACPLVDPCGNIVGWVGYDPSCTPAPSETRPA